MDVVAQTSSGRVRGRIVDGVQVFQGIPFAAAPVGARRLRPPEPPEPWSSVRDALAYGPKSHQPAYPPEIAILLAELTSSGDDCLTLNVWTPEGGAGGLPVTVWIPGGMFEYHGTSASPWYDGSRFARDGVVCVTVNYRVGADGFLFLDDGIANLGLLDQVAALEWVREDIAAFGGDRDRVTVFGESAGALSVGTLLAMPRAEGLFRRAVVQSGSAHYAQSPESGRRVARHLASLLGVEPTRDAFGAIPVDRLLAAQQRLRADLMARPDPEEWGSELVTTMMPWQPTIDGEVVPELPIDRIAAGAGSKVDLLVGSNVDETRLFLALGGLLDRLGEEALIGLVAAYGMPVGETIGAYRAAHPGASPGELFSAVQTDWYWRIPALRLADAHVAVGGRTFMYELAWRSPQFGGRLGACHALDIPLVFDTLGEGTEELMGPDPPQRLADAMHSAWVAFARDGDCGWAPYDLDRRRTMRFDVRPELVQDPLGWRRALFDGVR